MTERDFDLLRTAVNLSRERGIKSKKSLIGAMRDVGISDEDAERAIEVWTSLGTAPKSPQSP
jgi:hypothetical protein